MGLNYELLKKLENTWGEVMTIYATVMINKTKINELLYDFDCDYKYIGFEKEKALEAFEETKKYRESLPQDEKDYISIHCREYNSNAIKSEAYTYSDDEDYSDEVIKKYTTEDLIDFIENKMSGYNFITEPVLFRK